MSAEWWAAAAAIALCGLTLLSLAGAWLWRIFREPAVAEARKAQETAERALGEAQTAREKAAADLATFREHVAAHYVSTETLDKMETRVVDAINRLGDRLDAAFTPQPTSRSAPRKRVTKV